MVIDAALFVPQSRPRLFVIGVRGAVPAGVRADGPSSLWHSRALCAAYEKLPFRKEWIWWSLPHPAPRADRLEDLLEPGLSWFAAVQTRALLSLMDPRHRAKVEAAQAAGLPVAGGVFKRTRQGEQRAEVRFDGLSGCLRTPAGGSSRQIVMLVEGRSVRARLLSGRETARLMGLPESYVLPAGANETYHLTGDGVVVPVVRHLVEHLLEPVLRCESSPR